MGHKTPLYFKRIYLRTCCVKHAQLKKKKYKTMRHKRNNIKLNYTEW